MELDGRPVRLGASVAGNKPGVHAVRYNFVPESLDRRDATLRVSPDGTADMAFASRPEGTRYSGATSAARPCDFVLLPDTEVPGGLVLERVESNLCVRAARGGDADGRGSDCSRGIASGEHGVLSVFGDERRTANAPDDEFADLERDLLDDLGA